MAVVSCHKHFAGTPISNYYNKKYKHVYCFIIIFRLCAVFGGTYCLNRPLNSLILNGDNKITGVICDKKKISAEKVVIAPELCPEKCISSCKTQKISRAIFITDKYVRVLIYLN